MRPNNRVVDKSLTMLNGKKKEELKEDYFLPKYMVVDWTTDCTKLDYEENMSRSNSKVLYSQ